MFEPSVATATTLSLAFGQGVLTRSLLGFGMVVMGGLTTFVAGVEGVAVVVGGVGVAIVVGAGGVVRGGVAGATVGGTVAAWVGVRVVAWTGLGTVGLGASL